MEGPKVVEAETSPEPATGITLQSQLDNGQHLVLQTFIGRDASMASYHGVTDKLYRVVERQKWKTDLATLKGSIEQDERLQKAQEADFNRIEFQSAQQWEARGKKGEPKLTNAEEASRLNVRTSIKALRETITKKKDLVAELEKRLAEEPVNGG
jgi:hypothetical protein